MINNKEIKKIVIESYKRGLYGGIISTIIAIVILLFIFK